MWIFHIIFCSPRGDWENPSIVGINRLPCHTPLGYFSSLADLHASGYKSPFKGDNIISLDGQWDFAFGTQVLLLYIYLFNNSS